MRLRSAILIPLLAAVGCQDKKPDGSAGTAEATTAAATPTAAAPAAPPAEGTIAGKPFHPDAVTLTGNVLNFRAGKGPDLDLQLQIPVPEGEKLEGREWTLGGKPDGEPVGIREKGKQEPTYVWDYTATLRISKHTRDSAEGFIDLTVKNPPGTALRGHFTAAYRKTPGAPLDADDAPYVQGKIVLKGAKKTEKLAAGLVGKRDDGIPYSNEAGFPVNIGEPSYSTIAGLVPTQLSTLASSEAGLAYRHTRVPPGDYLVYVRRDGLMAAWKRTKLKAGDQQTIDLTIDPAATGEVVVTLPAGPAAAASASSLALVPVAADLPELGLGSEQYFNVATVKAGEKRVIVSGIPAGKYRAVRGTDEAVVDVVAGASTPVTLAPPKK
jgi:hypothetical protein